MMMHSHPMSITTIAIPEQARECVQLIQKCLRLTADRPHSLFVIAHQCVYHDEKLRVFSRERISHSTYVCVGSAPVLMGRLLQNK